MAPRNKSVGLDPSETQVLNILRRASASGIPLKRSSVARRLFHVEHDSWRNVWRATEIIGSLMDKIGWEIGVRNKGYISKTSWRERKE